jgi:hypothetical protein
MARHWQAGRHDLETGFWASISNGYGVGGGGGVSPSVEHGVCQPGVTRLPAMKFVCLIPRPAAMKTEDVHRYWLERHGPLLQSLAPALGFTR